MLNKLASKYMGWGCKLEKCLKDICSELPFQNIYRQKQKPKTQKRTIVLSKDVNEVTRCLTIGPESTWPSYASVPIGETVDIEKTALVHTRYSTRNATR